MTQKPTLTKLEEFEALKEYAKISEDSVEE